MDPKRTGEPLMGGTDGFFLWRSVIETGVGVVAS